MKACADMLDGAVKNLRAGLQQQDVEQVRKAHAAVRAHYSALGQNAQWIAAENPADRLRQLVTLLSQADRFLIDAGNRPMMPHSHADNANMLSYFTSKPALPGVCDSDMSSEPTLLASRTKALQNVRREMAALRKQNFARQAG